MASSEEGLAASLGELRVEAAPLRDSEVASHGNGADIVDDDDDIWDDAGPDSPGRGSILDREWAYRQNQFRKMGYRDGITEGQKDAAQEGFNIGFRESVHVGYKWGLLRGITSALASLPDNSKEKLLPNDQCRGRLQDLHNSIQEISSDNALQMFHKSTLDNNHPLEEPHIKSEEVEAVDSSRLETLPKDLLLLLHECPNIKVQEEMA
ncbi:uncharacterized protein YAE1 isoform X2 [Brachypodium distachyon]|uniref:Essential protein Yae1 N-terminal domain-containing protein n=1 Tax=Brachypodium distachyon TaxID=15368 RepID=I1IDX2_BRADI|nr:uncharacterized protein YAE1 isoform X2 [Brachypodium distachyon]KQK01359.1 hypothetical protein BRADI_3g55370v3 [Brachypodium distachyon]|eukprot:XP_003570398.1 uncharacterized protein YAE1 isoform X2 [Brachypodium distachyon]